MPSITPVTDFVLPTLLRTATTIQQYVTLPRPSGRVSSKFVSSDWNTIDGLSIVYLARKSLDGGVTWVSHGAFTAISPTFLKDGVTKVEPSGAWEWDGQASLFEVTVKVTIPFVFGVTTSFMDPATT